MVLGQVLVVSRREKRYFTWKNRRDLPMYQITMFLVLPVFHNQLSTGDEAVISIDLF